MKTVELFVIAFMASVMILWKNHGKIGSRKAQLSAPNVDEYLVIQILPLEQFYRTNAKYRLNNEEILLEDQIEMRGNLLKHQKWYHSMENRNFTFWFIEENCQFEGDYIIVKKNNQFFLFINDGEKLLIHNILVKLEKHERQYCISSFGKRTNNIPDLVKILNSKRTPFLIEMKLDKVSKCDA